MPDNIAIQSAYIKVRDLMCESTAMDIECYVFQGNNWSESSASWSSTNAGSSGSIGTHLCTVTMDYDIGRTFTNKHWYSFDITEAVQGWVDGTESLDSGIIFKMPTAHENGSTYTYRTIGSFNRSSNQPMGEITYTVSGGNIEVRTESTVALSTSGIDGVVTSWTSSNTSIATVSSSGVVTGVRAGEVTISAYSNAELQKTFTVRVLLADGVYWIGSAVDGLYMSANSGSISNGASVELHSLYSGLPNNLLQLWKICYLGNSQYSIRPMHKLDMALKLTQEDVDLQTVGTTDTLAGVPGGCKWYISYESGGYVFFNYEGLALTYPNGVGENGQLIGDVYSETDASFRWTVTRMSFPSSMVVFFDTNENALCTTATRYVAPGETLTLSELGLSASFVTDGDIDQNIQWLTGDPFAVSIDSNGTITGVGAGESTTIYAKQKDTDYYAIYTIHVTQIPEGDYFIKNKTSWKYVDRNQQTLENGAQIYQTDFRGTDTQRWSFIHAGDGTYYIGTADSTLYYLAVNSENGTDGESIILSRNKLKWRIENTASGVYRIILDGTENLTCATNISNTVELRASSNTNEWYIYQNNPLDLSVYFDSTYNSKCTSLNIDAITNISWQMQRLREVYLERFNISVTVDVPALLSTYADQCQYRRTDPNAECVF